MEGGGGGESVLLHIWAVVQDNPTIVPRNIVLLIVPID